MKLKYKNVEMACLRQSTMIFSKKNIYNLRKFQGLSTLVRNTMNFGSETIS